MESLRIVHEDDYVTPVWNAAERNRQVPPVTLIRTARFSPRLGADVPKDLFRPDDLRACDSYAVLTRLDRPGSPPFAGFLTWYPADASDRRWPYDVTAASGKTLWRLAYGFVAIDVARPDEPLLATLEPVADPVWERVRLDLHTVLATQLTTRLNEAHRHFEGDLGRLLTSRYGDHIHVRNRRAGA